MKRFCSPVLLVFVLAPSALALSTGGCRNKEEPPALQVDAGAAGVAASAAPPAAPGAPPAAEGEEEALLEGADAGADGGARRRRRLAAADAGPQTRSAEVAPAPVPTPVSTAAATAMPTSTTGKTAPQMGDDRPWGGGSGAASARVLERKPLPSEDPWGQSANSK